MDSVTRRELQVKAANVRLGILEEVFNAASGHPGGSLSIADIITYLYFAEMNVRAEEPAWDDRDRFVLSKGHTCPALYAALAEKGFFPKEDLKTFRHIDSYLQGHPDKKHIPGIDMSSGSLGQGISAACGMALAGKLQNKDYRVYTVLGDGESQEGQVWEAAMFAAHYKLDNLCAVLDFNGLQIDGAVTEVMNPTPLDDKFRAFGWHVIVINGHDFDAIEAAFNEAKTIKGQPTLILANTTKGKGVSYMENKAGWHGKAPNADEYAQGVAELNAYIETL